MHDPDGTRYDMMGGGGWMTGFAVLTVVLLLIAVLAVLANLFLHVSTTRDVRGVAGPSETRSPVAAGPSEARVLLDGRLARGEVAPEDYQALRTLLDG